MAIDEKRLEQALDLIKKAISKIYFPGAAVVVGHKGGIYQSAYYGERCIFPDPLPLLEDTLFDLASLTKVIGTTTLLTLFVERGILSIYDQVADYIEGFGCKGKAGITLLNLLTHTSGLPSHLPFYEICNNYEDTIRYISQLDLEYETGKKVVYSDLGFILLREVLVKAGGSPLDDLFKRYIFEPLEMHSTDFCPNTKNIAATEINPKTNQPLMGICHDENARFFGGISGHAGLFSNMKDLSKFANMLIGQGKVKEKVFIGKAAFQAMIRNYTEGLNEDRGYGWFLKGNKISSGGDIISPSAFGHTGFTGTSLWVDIEKDIYIILLTNRVHPTRENTHILRFRRVFHNAVLGAVKE